jgi:hypothetical protein
MPHYRDDQPYCKQPRSDHESGRQPKLAWFEVEETDSEVNCRNEDARNGAEPGKGYFEFSRLADGWIFGYQWATGERVRLPPTTDQPTEGSTDG